MADIRIFQSDFPDPYFPFHLTVLQLNAIYPGAPRVTGKETEAPPQKRKQEGACCDRTADKTFLKPKGKRPYGPNSPVP